MIELGESLRNSAIQGEFGYMDLAYTGRLMELGAQLTLFPLSVKGGIDSPRSLSVDFKSTARAVTAWLPENAESVVAVTNVSAQTVLVRLLIDNEDAKVAVAPHETVLRRQRYEKSTTHAISIDARFDGPPDAIRTFGYIMIISEAAIRFAFSDPAASTGAHLTALGLRTAAPTRGALRNLLDAALQYHLHFTEAGSLQPRTLDTPSATLAAHSTQGFVITKSLKELAEMGIQRATLTLATEADSKSFVASATQEIEDGILEDVPFRPG